MQFAGRISRNGWAAVFLALALALVSGANAQNRPGARLQSFETAPLTIESASGRHRFTVEIARSARQQAQGLMYRRRLAADAGMLFLYKTTQPVMMWMRNTFIPLDMMFIAADGRIVRIAERTVPLSLETISSGEPVSAVLEVNAGTAARLRIKPGDKVRSPAFDG